MAGEFNPVTKASTTPGMSSILGNEQLPWMGSNEFTLNDPYLTQSPGGTTTTFGDTGSFTGDTIDPSIVPIDPNQLGGDGIHTPGMPDFGSMSDADLGKYLGSPDFSALLGGLSGVPGKNSTPVTSGAGASGGGGGVADFLKNFFLGQPGQGTLGGLGPYAAVAGLGINQAKSAQTSAEKQADQLKQLGQPFSDQAKSMLDQFNSGKLRPDQQAVADLAKQQGSDILGSVSPLQKIAQDAFAQYSSGKLNDADELKLQQQVQAQKQQARDLLSRNGISDSSVLAAQDQQIDNQASVMRQDLLNSKFATGNQAYDSWLTGTREGQQLQMQGQQFASQAFETMLNDALGLGAEGMGPMSEAISLKINSDKELAQTVSELLGNLASAYSYAVAGPGNARTTNVSGSGGAQGGGGGGGGGGGNLLSSIVGGIGSIGNLVKGIGSLFGKNGTSSGGPKPAGGEAAAPRTSVPTESGGTYNFSPGYDFLGGTASTPSGLQNLDFSKTLNNPNASNAEVAQNLGVDPNLLTENLGGDYGVKDFASDAGNALGIYSGIKQGGAAGYAGAAKSAANLAGYNVPGLGYVDAVDKAVKGDIPSAAISAISTYLPVAGVAFAAGSLLNKAFMGGKTEDRNWALLTQGGGVKNVVLPGGHSAAFNGAALPDGRLISGADAKKLADLYWQATQEGTHQQELADFLKNVQPAKLPRGYTWDGTKFVRG